MNSIMRTARFGLVGFVFVISLAALLGWRLQSELLKTGIIGIGGIAQNPLTAITFCFAAASFCLAQPRWRSLTALSRLMALCVLAAGSLKVAEYVVGRHGGLDRFVFADYLADNRMAPNTAAGFMLAGLALLLIDTRWKRLFIGELFAVGSFLLGVLCLTGYLFNARAMYGIGAHIPMAANTALEFELLSLALLFHRPNAGILGIIHGRHMGDRAARCLLPVAVVWPLALAWTCLRGQEAGLYDPRFGGALMVTGTIILFAAAICWTAHALNNADRQRASAEAALHSALGELDDRVNQRTAELLEANRSGRQAAEELRQRDEQLRQAQKLEAIGTLAGGVAHEFNNLLQAIQVYGRFAQEGLAPGDQRFDDIQQIQEAASRAAALTRQLLGFGRRQPLELTNIDPNELVGQVVKLIAPLIGSNIEVHSKLDPNVGVIHADAGQFQQLMMNLCINARDAMPDGGSLWIKSEDVFLNERYCEAHPGIKPGRYLGLTVSDTGIGMPKEVVDHIFEPFFTTKPTGQGTGLGLSMVYGLVQQHQGSIHVYSEVGHGTTFRIYLPTVAGAALLRPSEQLGRAAGGKETILVADDDPLVHDAYVRVLGRAGYRLLSARNGKEAMQVFAEHCDEIDLAVLDVIMPHHSGREVHQQIRKSRPDLAVIFCSGYDPDSARLHLAEDGGDRFLQKPFDPDALLRAVRQALDQRVCHVAELAS